jgi:hypothetical protein
METLNPEEVTTLAKHIAGAIATSRVNGTVVDENKPENLVKAAVAEINQNVGGRATVLWNPEDPHYVDLRLHPNDGSDPAKSDLAAYAGIEIPEPKFVTNARAAGRNPALDDKMRTNDLHRQGR